jgi:histidine ammonia-lyase
MQYLEINGETLTKDQVITVAFGRANECQVKLSPEARVRVSKSAKAVEKLLERGEIAYGITTGFGAFKNKIINRQQVDELQKNIVLSHAVGVGNPLETPFVRAMMLIRANTLSRGYSGIKADTLDLLLDCLNQGVHPIVPEKGSLGASGDLAPLAHIACVLIGEGEAEYKGERMSGREALEQAGLLPVKLSAKEGLALTNGTTQMTAVGLIEAVRARKLADFADIVGCMSLEALNGTSAAFEERIHRLRPHPRQLETALRLRQIIEGSEMVRAFDPENIQDAYTLRCIPQVHGACRDAIAYAEWVIDLELNSVTDNPLIFLDEKDEEKIDVISGGNFHGEPLALAFDYLAMALTELGNISERRVMRLTDEASNSHVLPAFLTENGGLNSGLMIAQYSAAALCNENKVLSHPACTDTIPSSANVEDHVSMGANSALKLRQINSNLADILAIELLCAAQGIDFRFKHLGEKKRLGKGTGPVYGKVREKVPFIEKDTYLKKYIDACRQIVDGFVGFEK